jgi:hypothetical protein
MIKRFHEAPISIFDKVQKITDGDYFLVHLYESHPAYLRKYWQAKEQGRETILDNSIFELGEAFDTDTFANWVDKTEPTWYIVPDVLENSYGTLANLRKWNSEYRNAFPNSKKIAVVQGKSFDEIVRCYSEIRTSGEVDMIAISFDYSYYQESFPHPNKFVSWSLGRVKLLGDLLNAGVIDTSIPHHLLGISLPFEGIFYRQYDWLYSIDSSNPVVHGIKGIGYNPGIGLMWKESQKLHEMINYPADKIDWHLVKYNIDQFKKIWQHTT